MSAQTVVFHSPGQTLGIGIDIMTISLVETAPIAGLVTMGYGDGRVSFTFTFPRQAVTLAIRPFVLAVSLSAEAADLAGVGAPLPGLHTPVFGATAVIPPDGVGVTLALVIVHNVDAIADVGVASIAGFTAVTLHPDRVRVAIAIFAPFIAFIFPGVNISALFWLC